MRVKFVVTLLLLVLPAVLFAADVSVKDANFDDLKLNKPWAYSFEPLAGADGTNAKLSIVVQNQLLISEQKSNPPTVPATTLLDVFTNTKQTYSTSAAFGPLSVVGTTGKTAFLYGGQSYRIILEQIVNFPKPKPQNVFIFGVDLAWMFPGGSAVHFRVLIGGLELVPITENLDPVIRGAGQESQLNAKTFLYQIPAATTGKVNLRIERDSDQNFWDMLLDNVQISTDPKIIICFKGKTQRVPQSKLPKPPNVFTFEACDSIGTVTAASVEGGDVQDEQFNDETGF